MIKDCKICGAVRNEHSHCGVCGALPLSNGRHIDVTCNRYIARARGVRHITLSHASILPSYVQNQARMAHSIHADAKENS